MSVKIYTSVVVSVVLVALGLGLTPAFAATKDVPSTPTTFVTDEAQFVSPDAAADLERRLEAHHAATGQQVLLWIGRRDNRDAVEAWAARTFSAWGVGKRGRDDGVVLFILPAERKVRIEVGYGLEGALPDARAAQIIREAITPRLTKGDRDGAARAGVHAILVALGNPDDGQGSRGLSEPRPVVPDWISHPSWFEWL
ncbi:MAG TPA: TPM domain-containing protein, partial [Polyangia bacterium]